MWLVILAAFLKITDGQTGSSANSNGPFQCPCVQPSQSTCQQFDRRNQALSIEDAIDSFDDLTFDRSEFALSSITEDESCDSDDCKNCRLFMRAKLIQVGLMKESPLTAFLKTDLSTKTCSRYRFSSSESLAREWLRGFYNTLRTEALINPQGAFDVALVTFNTFNEIRNLPMESTTEDNLEHASASEKSGSAEQQEVVYRPSEK
ncbi:hypothetical protein PENTCL1PPCAC_30181, partial [Pristionchus entomophagus]